MMTRERLETARVKLSERRQKLLRRQHTHENEERELLGSRTPDWEDAATDLATGALLHSLSESERGQLARVQSALHRIEAGTYGRCLACGGFIEEGRLAALPEAERCASCNESN